MSGPDLLGSLSGASAGPDGAVPDAGGPGLRCSRRGCREGAAWALRWNNPRLHTPQRRKTWLACEGHLEYLREYLDTRGLLREVVPVPELPAAEQRDPSPREGK